MRLAGSDTCSGSSPARSATSRRSYPETMVSERPSATVRRESNAPLCAEPKREQPVAQCADILGQTPDLPALSACKLRGDQHVCGDGVGVPWAIRRQGVDKRGNPLASSFIASCLNTRPKASSSSASFGPTLPLANRKQRSAWTCRWIASDIVSPVSIEHPPDRHDRGDEAYAPPPD